MNRFYLLLAASALGMGCGGSSHHIPCDTRTVAVGWPSFQLADGTVTSSCTTAHVSDVDVFMDDTPVTTVACSAAGVNVTGVPNNGNHLFTVEARDSTTNAIALRDEQTVGNSNCTNLLLDTEPSEGTFVLNFSFSPDLCTSSSNSFIWFTVHDVIANQDIAVDGSHSPQSWTCGNGSTTTPVPISFPLASGSYTLDRTEEVLYPGPTQQAGNCNATSFTVAGATQSRVDVPLTDAVSCF
jgi:hypothetical protein